VPNLPAAFMSYAQFDDNHDHGFLTKFRARLSDEIRMQSGRDFRIFQDREGLRWGQNWQRRIHEALDNATYLIPMMTPNFFRSQSCREEVERFLDRERELNRDDLILPIYYVESDEVRQTSNTSNDLIAQALCEHQYIDWRKLRGMPVERQLVQQTIVAMARRITISLNSTAPGESQTENTPSPERIDLDGPIPSPDSPSSEPGSTVVSLVDSPATQGKALRRASRRSASKQGNRKDNSHVMWAALEAELEKVTFRSTDATILAVKTRNIRKLLTQSFPAYHTSAAEISLAKDALTRALESALSANVTPADFKSSCEQAERLRKLLSGLISDRQ
jgi:hypothetical protein